MLVRWDIYLLTGISSISSVREKYCSDPKEKTPGKYREKRNNKRILIGFEGESVGYMKEGKRETEAPKVFLLHRKAIYHWGKRAKEGR
jgi:hypothetical protein